MKKNKKLTYDEAQEIEELLIIAFVNRKKINLRFENARLKELRTRIKEQR